MPQIDALEGFEEQLPQPRRIELSDVVAEIGDFANALQAGIGFQLVDDVIGGAAPHCGRLSSPLGVQCHVAVDAPDGEAIAV